MKKYLIGFLFIVSIIFSQGVGLNVSLIGHFPQEEFKAAGVTTGFGLDFNGMYYMVDELAFGLNLGGSVYDISKRSVQLLYDSPLVNVTEETSNNIGYGHLFIKIVPFQTKVKPYFEGLIGMKNLNTKTKVKSQSYSCDDPETDHDECELAQSTNASDNAFSYGFGAGFEVQLIDYNNLESDKINSGLLSFFFSLRYLYGNEAKYLKKGSIEFYYPEGGGPAEAIFNWSQSKTDLIQLNLGLQMKF